MDINTYEIIFTDTAREELEGIYEYISEDLSEIKAANRLINKIEQSVNIRRKSILLFRSTH